MSSKHASNNVLLMTNMHDSEGRVTRYTESLQDINVKKFVTMYGVYPKKQDLELLLYDIPCMMHTC